MEVAAAEVPLRRILFGGIDGLFQRDEVEALLAEVHEHEVDGEAMEPGGEGRLAAEAADLAEEMEEGLLGHVFSLRDIPQHAEAEGVNTTLVESIQLGKCVSISIFCGLNRFGFTGDRGISFE